MRGPHSYTAEDTVEIDCHGGVLAPRKAQEQPFRTGLRVRGRYVCPAEVRHDGPDAFLRAVLHAVLELGLSDNSFNLFHTLNNLRLDNLRFTICLSVCVNHRFFILET